MARKLDTNDFVKIALTAAFPGLGHLIAGEVTTGILFFVVACLIGCVAGPAAWLIGGVAAYHLFTKLSNEEIKELPTVDFKSLPKKSVTKDDDDEKPDTEKKDPKVVVSAQDEPAEEKPATTVPADEPATKDEPTTKAEPASEPSEDEPAVDEPAVDEPAESEPAVDEPAVAESGGTESEPKLELPTPPPDADGEEFARTESKSRIPAFKLSIPKPGEVSEAEADWPELIPYLTKKLNQVEQAMLATGEFLEARGRTWKTTKPDMPETTPLLLREVATELGAVEFDSLWSHGWPFAADQKISLFQQLEREGKGWRFAHDSDDPSALSLIWMPSGEVVKRVGTELTTVAEDLGAFIDDLGAGFRVAQAAEATQAVMEADHLTVLPAAEVSQGDQSADFPDFWMGASGPGLSNVGWSFESPYIRNPFGARLADGLDMAIIEVFHEWLTTDAESPDGAVELAKMANNTIRPVGKVLLDGEVVVAWWGESPPEEVDAFVDHLRGLVYAKS